jgi:hypothetical protein
VRIEGLTARRAPWSALPIYGIWKRIFGKVLTPHAVLAHRPSLLWTLFLSSIALHLSRVVDRKLKILVSLRAAQMVGCPF